MLRLRSPMLLILVELLVARAALADLTLVGDKLTLDATVRAGAHWWRAEQAGLSHSEFAFERVGALVGFTGQPHPVVSLRASGDIGGLEPQDLCVDLHWGNGFRLRTGQFLLPLGMDAMTEPDSQVLAGSSFLVGYAKPDWIRDIGVLASWETGRLSAAVAVVNGSGANASDKNTRKDLCGRISVRPLSTFDADLAMRVYYGWPDSLWRSAAFEARVRRGQLTLQAELQNHRSQYARNNMAYLQVAWNAGLLEPVGRFDIVLPHRMRAEWNAVAGINASPLSDHLRVMLDCSYHRNYQANWAVFGFGLRLQADL